jgi:hypothetical protein
MTAPHPSPLPSGERVGAGVYLIWVIGIYLRFGAWNLVLSYGCALCPMRF